MPTRITLLLAVLAGAGTMAAGIALDRQSAATPARQTVAPPPGPLTAIVNVRVFDGATVVPSATVVIEGDHIAAVGEGLRAPAGAAIVDGTGRTLMPGLIDAHTHASGDALERALLFGVTTELDMFSDPSVGTKARAEQLSGRVTSRADLRSAGILVTAPGGHGTEFGMSIPTLQAAGEARAFVDARIAEGSDYIKIVRDDGSAYGYHWPTLTDDELAAVVSAAHWRQKLAVVHIGTGRDALAAIDAGADGLVHLFVDSAPVADFGARVAAHRAFVIPTLTVLEGETGQPSGASLVHDARLAPWLTDADKQNLAASFPMPDRLRTLKMDHARAAVRALQAAGVALLAGTDAPNPGTTHGASIHRELELLVSAGLTPLEALVAATATPARVFGLRDRGRVAPGLRADLVLVAGDPTSDITSTRAIVYVWRNGAGLTR